MSDFDEKTLLELSKLCRIECSKEEQEKITANFQSILDYVDQLREVNTDGVKPCHYVHETYESVLREDEVGVTLDRETFLKNSPSHTGGMLKVPTVIKF